MSLQLTLIIGVISAVGIGGIGLGARAFIRHLTKKSYDQGRADEQKRQAEINEKDVMQFAKEIAAQRDHALTHSHDVDDTAGWLIGVPDDETGKPEP